MAMTIMWIRILLIGVVKGATNNLIKKKYSSSIRKGGKGQREQLVNKSFEAQCKMTFMWRYENYLHWQKEEEEVILKDI